ncbi:MAG: xanthine dehydrogenase family protein molybdopterin-binding subunit [Sedimentibacter sp.]
MKKEKEFRYIGKELSNDRAYGKVTGAVQYCGDLQSVNMLHMKLKPSTIAHGYIKSIDISEAEKIEGVKAIYTYLNTPDKKFDRGRAAYYENVPYQEKLFDRHIRFMGERVAGVVAVSEEIAEYACQKIKVEYEELPAAITVEDALKENAVKIHEEGNICVVPEINCGDYEGCTAENILKSKTRMGRITHLTMETHASRALFEKSTGKLTIWSPCQTAFGIRSTVAELLDMPFSKVRVIKAVMGGSFGCKQETILEPLTAYAAKDLKADVKLVFTREEQIINTMLRHNADITVESKINNDGKIEGLSVSAVLDSGAYQTVSPSYASTMGAKLGKVYRLKNLHYDGKSVCTNTPVNGSFRSWGSSEIALPLENHLNMVAEEMNIDPIELRLMNVMDEYEMDIVQHVPIGNAHFKKCLTEGRDAFGWENRKESCKEKNKNGRYRYGIGMAVCSHTSSFYPYMVDMANAAVRLQEDGSLIINVGIHDHGCGTVMAMKKIAAEVMEMDIERIELKEIDTEVSIYDYGCFASRTVYCLGNAVKKCCEQLLEKARNVAANALQCNKYHLIYEDEVFYKENNPQLRMDLKGISIYSITVMGEDVFETYTYNASEGPGVPAAHFTEVEVDTFTGMVRVVDCLSVHDIGKAINPDLCRGQVGSGIQQGIGIALCEDIKIHPKTGKTLIDNLKNYEVTNAFDMPDYKTIFIEEEEKNGPFGAKSIGEVVIVPVAPAIVAAVNNALGTKFTETPLTPSVILEALAKEN